MRILDALIGNLKWEIAVFRDYTCMVKLQNSKGDCVWRLEVSLNAFPFEVEPQIKSSDTALSVYWEGSNDTLRVEIAYENNAWYVTLWENGEQISYARIYD